jgi:hypothetical protein
MVEIAEAFFTERDFDVLFVLYSGVTGNAAVSPLAYLVSSMPYATGRAEIPYGGPPAGSRKKASVNKVGQAMTAMDWKMMAHSISHASQVKGMPLIGGLSQMDGSAAPPAQDSGKVHIMSLFPNPGDMDTFTAKIASKMSEAWRVQSWGLGFRV